MASAIAFLSRGLSDVTVAVPLSWLTEMHLTPSKLSSVFRTVASQWPHIIPFILSVTVSMFSGLSPYFSLFPKSLTKFRRRALVKKLFRI